MVMILQKQRATGGLAIKESESRYRCMCLQHPSDLHCVDKFRNQHVGCQGVEHPSVRDFKPLLRIFLHVLSFTLHLLCALLNFPANLRRHGTHRLSNRACVGLSGTYNVACSKILKNCPASVDITLKTT